MPQQAPCPRCGAPCYVTDAQCLSCGLQLDEGRDATLRPEPAPATETAPPEPSVAAAPAGDMPPRPLLITVVAVLAIVGASLAALAGLGIFAILMIGGFTEGTRPDAADARTYLLTLAGALLLCGGAGVSGLGLWHGARWARWVMMGLCVLGMVQTLLLITPVWFVLVPFGLLINGGILYGLWSPAAKSYCRH